MKRGMRSFDIFFNTTKDTTAYYDSGKAHKYGSTSNDLTRIGEKAQWKLFANSCCSVRDSSPVNGIDR